MFLAVLKYYWSLNNWNISNTFSWIHLIISINRICNKIWYLLSSKTLRSTNLRHAIRKSVTIDTKSSVKIKQTNSKQHKRQTRRKNDKKSIVDNNKHQTSFYFALCKVPTQSVSEGRDKIYLYTYASITWSTHSSTHPPVRLITRSLTPLFIWSLYKFIYRVHLKRDSSSPRISPDLTASTYLDLPRRSNSCLSSFHLPLTSVQSSSEQNTCRNSIRYIEICNCQHPANYYRAIIIDRLSSRTDRLRSWYVSPFLYGNTRYDRDDDRIV